MLCNLCGANDTRALFALRDYRLEVDDVRWTAVQCRNCGLGYLNPRPTRDEVGRYYPTSYFGHREAALDRYRALAEYVLGPPARLLDVGTAGGHFLEVMGSRGWDVMGIEPTGEPRSDLPIVRCPFPEGCELPSRSFDVITAWAVFEHLHDPSGAFRECARMLRADGRLVVQVPNLRSIWARWAMLEDVPRHLYFFSPRTLRRYGEQAGLELRRVHHTTDLFGGSGRGVLRLAYCRLLGKSLDDFFEIWRTPRAIRHRRWPVLAAGWTFVAAIERVLLPDWLIRKARISGQIVVEFGHVSQWGDGAERPQAAC